MTNDRFCDSADSDPHSNPAGKAIFPRDDAEIGLAADGEGGMGDPKNTRALQAAFHVAESGSNDAAQAPGRQI